MLALSLRRLGVRANWEIPKVPPSQKVFLHQMNGSVNIRREELGLWKLLNKGTKKYIRVIKK